MTELAIESKNLSYSIGTIKILDQCSIQIKKSTIMCIIGANGCGKTTLLNCLLGFYDVPRETIFINGTDIRKLTRSQIAKNVSYVQQISQNDSNLEVYDYLSLGRIAHKKLYQKLDAQDKEIIDKIAHDTGITKYLHKSLLYLSGGEKQLVMIAKALVQDTEIIIMDEPSSALDFGNQAVLMQQLKKMNQAGKTIIFTTHNPNHALALNSDVCIMNKGVIQTIGKATDCICPSVLKDIYGKGIKFISNDNTVVCSFVVD